MTIAMGAVWAGERLLSRLRGVAPAAASAVDYRFAAAGAVLPDVVDKPLAWVLFRGTFDDSHLFGHTLLFSLSLIALGLVAARRGEVRLLLVGIGALVHLPVDPVARNPSTLLWPLFGTEFDHASPVVPFSIVAEGAILVGLALAVRKAVWRERIRRFVMTGAVDGLSRLDAASSPQDT